MGNKCIGIDVGGTSVKVGLFETTGDLLLKWEVPTRKEEGGKYIIGDVAASILKTLEEKLGKKLVISDKAQLCGALGAALFAADMADV